MKVSIGMALQSGPWGGGNQFGHALVGDLRGKGETVTFDLRDPDLDIILMTEPRMELGNSNYSLADIDRYLREVNRRALVLHRVNECDERKGRTGVVNPILIWANRFADHTVFISAWLRDLFLGQGMKPRAHTVIQNGADATIFNATGHVAWNGREPLRLVTHHWGGGFQKGIDVYREIDRLMGEPEFAGRLAFTYVGNLPEGVCFSRAAHVAPQSGHALAETIRSHHVYVTAAQNEPAGMHHIEGAMCGLPVLYIASGALPEYCGGFGLSFTPETFTDRLHEMMATYPRWVARMRGYPHTAERMCEQYHTLMKAMVEGRESVLNGRSLRMRLSGMMLGSRLQLRFWKLVRVALKRWA
jgi:hypothetical protein